MLKAVDFLPEIFLLIDAAAISFYRSKALLDRKIKISFEMFIANVVL